MCIYLRVHRLAWEWRMRNELVTSLLWNVPRFLGSYTHICYMDIKVAVILQLDKSHTQSWHRNACKTNDCGNLVPIRHVQLWKDFLVLSTSNHKNPMPIYLYVCDYNHAFLMKWKSEASNNGAHTAPMNPLNRDSHGRIHVLGYWFGLCVLDAARSVSGTLHEIHLNIKIKMRNMWCLVTWMSYVCTVQALFVFVPSYNFRTYDC